MDILMVNLRIFLYSFSLLMLFFGSGMAQLSPGDLHRSHKHLEGIENCTSCHESGEKLSADKCLDCHLILKKEINAKKGLHSRSEFQVCADCHVEHQGRDFDLIYWKEGIQNFDHTQTGYRLEGKHKNLKCRNLP